MNGHGKRSNCAVVQGTGIKLPISAVVVTFNEGRRLSESLKSISFCNEIIVCDLGSSDDSREIASSIGAKQIQRATVPVASMYKGRRYLRSFLDNVTSQTIFNRTELIIIDANSPEGEEEIIADEVARCGYVSQLPIVTRNNLLMFNSPHNAPMWRKSLHAELGLFDATFQSAGDYEFWLRCLLNGKVFFKLNAPHVVYFHNPEGISTRADTLGVKEARQLIRRYYKKMMSSYLLMSRQAFAKLLGIKPDRKTKTACYDVVQNQLKALGDRYKAEINQSL